MALIEGNESLRRMAVDRKISHPVRQGRKHEPQARRGDGPHRSRQLQKGHYLSASLGRSGSRLVIVLHDARCTFP